MSDDEEGLASLMGATPMEIDIIEDILNLVMVSIAYDHETFHILTTHDTRAMRAISCE